MWDDLVRSCISGLPAPILIIAHGDPDGLGAAATFIKWLNRLKLCNWQVVFTHAGAERVLKTITKATGEKEYKSIVILDLLFPSETVPKSIQNVINIDHHVVESKQRIWKDGEILFCECLNPAPSATAIVQRLLCGDSTLEGIINQIDSANIKTPEAQIFADWYSHLKRNPPDIVNKQLTELVDKIASSGFDILQFIEEQRPLSEAYRVEMVNLVKDINPIFIETLDGKKGGLVKLEPSVNTTEIYEELLKRGCYLDFLVVLKYMPIEDMHTVGTKLEFRSKEMNVRALAEKFGGSGHLQSCGAFIPKKIGVGYIISAIGRKC